MGTSKTKRPGITSVMGVAVGLALTLTLSPGAYAASTGEDDTTTTTTGQSCWFDLDSTQSVCVETGSGLIEAVEEQTGIVLDVPDGAIIDGEVYHDDAPMSTQRESEYSPMAAAAPAASTVVAALYDDIDYGGGTLVLSASGSCGTYGFSSLVGYGWNDRASSYRAYNGCRGIAYRDINFGGTSTSATANASSLGSMNDQASSFRVTP